MYMRLTWIFLFVLLILLQWGKCTKDDKCCVMVCSSADKRRCPSIVRKMSEKIGSGNVVEVNIANEITSLTQNYMTLQQEKANLEANLTGSMHELEANYYLLSNQTQDNITALKQENEILRSKLNGGCHQTKYLFPRDDQTSDYIRVKTSVQQMSNFTICFWVSPLASNSKARGGVFSYASPGDNNAVTIYFKSSESLWIIRDEEKTATHVITERTHVCFGAELPNATIYINGRIETKLSYSFGTVIAGSGALIIGNEQDQFMGGFTNIEAFSGTIENLMLWYRLLDSQEINAMINDSCTCPKDYAIDLTPDAVQLEGWVTAEYVESCEI